MIEHRLPLLVTGIAGVAGYNAFLHLSRLYPGQVFGIRPLQTFRLVGAGVIALDAEDADGMHKLFDEVGFRSVLNCVGNCALKSCELDPEMARRVNVESCRVMLENVRRHDARLVQLSCDLVYSGHGQGRYREADPTDPVTVYGKTMVQAEDLTSYHRSRAAILRISLPMGPSFNRHAGAIDWIQSRFRADRPATLYFDEVRSATYCDDLNDVFQMFLGNNASGLFHCGGPRPVTLYNIGQIVNRVGGYAPELLKGCPRIEAGPMPPRAGNVSMDSSKLHSELGNRPFRPWPAEEILAPTNRHWHKQRSPDESGSFEMIQKRLYRYEMRS